MSRACGDEYQERRGERGYAPDVAAAVEQERLGAKLASEGGSAGLRGATGTPAQLREFLARYEEAGVDQVIFVMQAGKNRHEHICEAIELFGNEVLPAFKEREEARAAAKARRLEPVVEQVMARKVDDAPALPEGFSFPAMPRKAVDAAGDTEAREWMEKLAQDRAEGRRDSAAGIVG